jgi:hypothetical protein
MVVDPDASSNINGRMVVVGNRRDLLVRVGSWMKHSWRRSRESLMDINEGDDDDDRCVEKLRQQRQRQQHEDDDDDDADDDDVCNDDECCRPAPCKHVHFNISQNVGQEDDDEGDDDDEEDEEELVVTIIPTSDEDSMISEDQMKQRWFQVSAIIPHR